MASVLLKGGTEAFYFNGTMLAEMSNGWMVIYYPPEMIYLNLYTKIGTKVLRFANADLMRG